MPDHLFFKNGQRNAKESNYGKFKGLKKAYHLILSTHQLNSGAK